MLPFLPPRDQPFFIDDFFFKKWIQEKENEVIMEGFDL
jgi:hypothetical protein